MQKKNLQKVNYKETSCERAKFQMSSSTAVTHVNTTVTLTITLVYLAKKASSLKYKNLEAELLLAGPPLPNRLAKPGLARAPSPPVTNTNTQ